MSNIVMGVDPSFTNAGISICCGEELLYVECVKTSPDFDTYRRASAIADRILDVAKEHGVTHCVVEGLAMSFGRNNSSNAITSLSGLHYLVVDRLNIKNNLPVQIVAPKSLKKFAVGTGNAKKNQMMDGLPEDIYEQIYSAGYKRTTGLADAADAYWLAQYWIKENEEN